MDLFERTFDCLVLNLARTPQRLTRFNKQNAGLGISFRRVEAADGREISFDQAARLNLVKPGTKWSSPGTLGVALSHRNLWEKSISEKRSIVIFEDDAVIRHDLKAELLRAVSLLPPRWDIILLGYNTDSLLEFNVIADFDLSCLFSVRYPSAAQLEKFARSTDPVGLFRLRHAFGLCGYAISPWGATKMIARCYPMDNRLIEFPATDRRFPAYSIDCMMNVFYRDIRAFVCIPPLVLAPNDKALSTVSPRHE